MNSISKKEKCPSHFKAYISQEEIRQMLERMAQEIEATYPDDEELICVGVLKGAWVVLADLVRLIPRPVTIDFIRAQSYGNAQESSGLVKIEKDIEMDVKGKHVLLVEEIVDTGRTLSLLKSRVEEAGAKTVKIAALLDKSSRRVVPCPVDFLGREIEDHFVVGYGLDWAEKYRDLKDIYIVPNDS